MKDKHDWSKADEWIKTNSNCTWSEFQKQFPQFPFTDATFYNRKTKLLKKQKKTKDTTTRSYRMLYQTLTTLPQGDVSTDELKGMKRMNDILQKYTKIKIEIVQLVDPSQIEIRQCQTR